MKTDRLYSSLFFSFCLHSLLVIVSVIYMRYSGIHYKVDTFVVSLVDTSSGSQSSSSAEETAKSSAPPEEKSTHMTEQPEKVSTKEKSEANERIAALEAKKKIETLARLRKTVTVSAAKTASGSMVLTSGKGSSGGSDYLSLIGGKIHQQWIFPDTTDKDLLAIIHITIARNGNVTILGFEKKSGNVLFDRAAIRAITSASPLPPPSMQMDIYFKFSP
jgi:colicin import membrane protein